ncbi:MAG TPA: aromatic ring-hydroxylating dioxygenase subunit alpha [Stellaceae bacterium]|nr:aromatic ring-hydroxylating dioxygenase subunit alpha [Stellaceae bacterium]
MDDSAPRPKPEADGRRWPEGGLARVPYWIYTDPEIYRSEQERIFCGRSWAYVALEAELPKPGDFIRTYVGEKPVVVVRDLEGGVNVLLNRCAHRGVEFCQNAPGNAREFMCPYHQWTYDLKGNLMAVPFRRGVRRQGGMPEDFRLEEHGLTRFQVARRNGVIFASLSEEMPALEDYLGPTMLGYFDRVFDGRPLKVLGYMRQRIEANWKLMFENIKDPYHASLLHVFLVSFGLFRADQPSAVEMDESGMHSALVSMRGEQQASEGTAEMKSFRADFKLADPRLLDPVREFAGNATVVMQTIWPNLIVQQQSNTLAMRQLVTRGPTKFDLMWTFFGYESDPPDMTERRIRQANLMGPSGFVSVDDGEIMEFSQHGIGAFSRDQGVVEMGGRDVRNEDHMVTEAAIRGFYRHYRAVMGL